jgi:mannose-1-phosphate guanylyltransferase
MNNKPLVLIMCGGRSLRLWPLSEYKSKNFMDIFGFSPLEITIRRYLKITTKDNIFLVANKSERKALTKLKLIKKSNIFFEPESKNTAAAVLLSLQHLKRFPDKSIIISPVDHLIKGEKEFYKALRKAQEVSKQGCICTLGIKPLEPTPNFGYIQTQSQKPKGVFAVKRFIENQHRL